MPTLRLEPHGSLLMSTPSPSSVPDEKSPSALQVTLALILGIASIPLGWLLGYAVAVPCSVLAIIFGSMALRRARRDQNTAAVRKRAVGGLVAAVVGIALPLVLNLLIGPEL